MDAGIFTVVIKCCVKKVFFFYLIEQLEFDWKNFLSTVQLQRITPLISELMRHVSQCVSHTHTRTHTHPSFHRFLISSTEWHLLSNFLYTFLLRFFFLYPPSWLHQQSSIHKVRISVSLYKTFYPKSVSIRFSLGKKRQKDSVLSKHLMYTWIILKISYFVYGLQCAQHLND